MDKKTTRLRRARRSRFKIKELAMHRLTVHRTPRHIYAQILAPTGGVVVVQASTLDAEVKADIAKSKKSAYTGNILAAVVVGGQVAGRAKEAGISTVAFDRSGFKYHGRIKALADAARANGLKF